MLIKAAGAVMIMTSGILIGISLKHGLTEHLLQLKDIKNFLLYSKRKINYDMPSLSELFLQYKGDTSVSLIKNIAMFITNESTPEISIQKAFELSNEIGMLSEQETNYIKSILLQLGESDCNSQINLIDSAVAQLDYMIQEADKERETKSKVYMSISVYTGVVFAILML